MNINQNIIKATVTPLASIFGSGFLVIVPILAAAVGEYAVLAMLLICAIAYAVGNVIRFNIQHAEAAFASNAAQNPGQLALFFERSSNLAIVLAYVISVCLYLNIMAAFVLGGLNMDTPFNERLVTSAIVSFIIAIGLIRGLDMLEKLESYALYITMGVIVLLLAGFAFYDEKQIVAYSGFTFAHALDHTPWQVLTIVAGTLIVVQGFETPRFMSASYDTATRIKASRLSQIIATVVYVLFVALALPIVHVLNGQYDDNSLIKLAAAASALLVLPLVISAALSQFAAAVADTIAATGNMSEASRGKINEKWGYVIVGCGAIALTWSADTFQILALASRAFALYYLLQTLVAIRLSDSLLQKSWMTVIALILAFITVFAVPAG